MDLVSISGSSRCLQINQSSIDRREIKTIVAFSFPENCAPGLPENQIDAPRCIMQTADMVRRAYQVRIPS
jgi:hypothetical protein